MSLGLEASGFDIAAAVEFDAIHTLVHHSNFPYSASLCEDISRLESASILNAIQEKGYGPQIDLVAGGPPCQGFSHIGKRQIDDPRNQLVFDFVRIIKELTPSYFIFENVPGIASGKHRKFLDELISEFESIGYRVAKPISILDASHFGAPQKRKRLILIGSRLDCTPALYPDVSHGAGGEFECSLFEQPLLPLNTVGDAISDLEKFEVFTELDQGLLANDLDYTGLRESFSMAPSGMFALCHRREMNNRVYGHIGSKHTQISIDRFESTPPGTVEPISRFYKPAKDGQSNTIRAGTASDKGAYTAPRPIHYSQPRCITVREAARLHTFPDWFRFHNTIWHGFREIGNAVVPFLAKRLGDRVIDALGVDTCKLETRTLDGQDARLLNYNMAQASSFWNVENDVIPKRKRLY